MSAYSWRRTTFHLTHEALGPRPTDAAAGTGDEHDHAIGHPGSSSESMSCASCTIADERRSERRSLVEVTAAWPSEPIALLPNDLTGQRVLDVACGYGRTARYLAVHGAVVTAVDISENPLEHGRALTDPQSATVRLCTRRRDNLAA
jgi:SAM-dependent methyltransferase